MIVIGYSKFQFPLLKKRLKIILACFLLRLFSGWVFLQDVSISSREWWTHWCNFLERSEAFQIKSLQQFSTWPNDRVWWVQWRWRVCRKLIGDNSCYVTGLTQISSHHRHRLLRSSVAPFMSSKSFVYSILFAHSHESYSVLEDINSIIRFALRSVKKDRGMAAIFCSLDSAVVSESDKRRKVFKMKAKEKGEPG